MTDTQKTLNGRTAGGILKTAKILCNRYGNYSVNVRSRGRQYEAMLTDAGRMVLSSPDEMILLELSGRALLKLHTLCSNANALTNAEARV